MKSKKRKVLPRFRSEEAERSFWSTRDSADYVDWGRGTRRSFPNLKPSLRTISIRLPEAMIGHLKVLANKRDLPYQSLLKEFLAERLKTELGSTIREVVAPWGTPRRPRARKPRA